MLGAGEGQNLTKSINPAKVVQAKTDFDVFTKQPKKIIRKKWNIFDIRSRL
jgi:hypothetical protein